MNWAEVELTKEHREDLLHQAQKERLIRNSRVQPGRVRTLIERLHRQR